MSKISLSDDLDEIERGLIRLEAREWLMFKRPMVVARLIKCGKFDLLPQILPKEHVLEFEKKYCSLTTYSIPSDISYSEYVKKLIEADYLEKGSAHHLHDIVSLNQAERIPVLVSYGFINGENEDGDYPIHTAIATGSLGAVFSLASSLGVAILTDQNNIHGLNAFKYAQFIKAKSALKILDKFIVPAPLTEEVHSVLKTVKSFFSLVLPAEHKSDNSDSKENVAPLGESRFNKSEIGSPIIEDTD